MSGLPGKLGAFFRRAWRSYWHPEDGSAGEDKLSAADKQLELARALIHMYKQRVDSLARSTVIRRGRRGGRRDA